MQSNIKINYQPHDNKFHLRLAFPIGFQNKLDSDLRYYKTKEEYKPVLLKEALLLGSFLILFFAAFAWLNINTIKWEFFLPFSGLLIILFIGMIYKRRVNKFHKQPYKIYEQIKLLFEGTNIANNTLTEQSTYCFRFSKNSMDCEISYNIYRKVYHLYIYPSSGSDNIEEKADKFVDVAKGKWIYDEDEDGFFLACTIKPDDTEEFREVLAEDTLLAKEML